MIENRVGRVTIVGRVTPIKHLFLGLRLKLGSFYVDFPINNRHFSDQAMLMTVKLEHFKHKNLHLQNSIVTHTQN